MNKKRKHNLFLLVQNINKHLYFSYFELKKQKKTNQKNQKKQQQQKQFLKLQIKQFFDSFTTFRYVSVFIFYFFNRIDSIMYLSLIEFSIFYPWNVTTLCSERVIMN